MFSTYSAPHWHASRKKCWISSLCILRTSFQDAPQLLSPVSIFLIFCSNKHFFFFDPQSLYSTSTIVGFVWRRRFWYWGWKYLSGLWNWGWDFWDGGFGDLLAKGCFKPLVVKDYNGCDLLFLRAQSIKSNYKGSWQVDYSFSFS